VSKKLPVSLAATGVVTALAIVLAGLGAEGQAIPAVYGQWTVAPADPTSTGTLSLPGSQVPDAPFETNGNNPQVPSGASAFLGDSTPFGAEYSSSQDLPYLVLRTDSTAPSTTTFTFAAPTPASGWGFAFGDIDADTVKVEAFDAAGAAVPTAALGWQSAFNYCTNSPRPTSCGAGPFTDVPTWDPGTSTLVGNGPDTTGAAGWFRPTAPITTLKLTFTRISGAPVMQMWVASHCCPPPTTTSTSTSTTSSSTSSSTSTSTTSSSTTSTSTTVPSSTTVSSTTAPPTTTPPTTGPSTSLTPTTAPTPPPAPPAPRLADTGAQSGRLALIGTGLMALGALVAHAGRRRRRST